MHWANLHTSAYQRVLQRTFKYAMVDKKGKFCHCLYRSRCYRFNWHLNYKSILKEALAKNTRLKVEKRLIFHYVI